MKHSKRTSIGKFNNADHQCAKWLKDPRPWNEDRSLSQEPNGKRSHIRVRLRSKDRNIWPTFINNSTTIIFGNSLNSFWTHESNLGFHRLFFGALRSNLFKYSSFSPFNMLELFLQNVICGNLVWLSMTILWTNVLKRFSNVNNRFVWPTNTI